MWGIGVTIWTAIAVFALDQATKIGILVYVDLPTRQIVPVFPPYLTFKMAWNEGINFGLFSDHGEAIKWGLIALALVISGWIVWWMKRDVPGKLVQVSAGLVVGGAIGNALDRLLYGAVADFLNMSCCGFENPYSFNVADISIFVGAAGLILFAGDGREKSG